jgi:hypothetical protein
MVKMIKFSDTIPPQEYEKKRDKVIELLTKVKEQGVLMSLSYLNYHLKLDEYYPPAYVIGRKEKEGILKMGGFYDKTDNNKLVMTAGYRLKR